MDTSRIFWNLEIGNLEISGSCLVLPNFNILGIFPTQFMSLSLIFNFQLLWNLEIWEFTEIGYFWPISIYWVFSPLSLGHWAWFSTQNFKSPIFLESGNWKSGNSRKLASFAQFQYFGYFSAFYMNLEILSCDFKIILYDPNWVGKIPKLAQTSQEFPDSRKMEIWNCELNIKVSDLNYVGKYTIYWNWPKLANFREFTDFQFPDFRRIGNLKFWLQNQCEWPKLNGKNTQYNEISQN